LDERGSRIGLKQFMHPTRYQMDDCTRMAPVDLMAAVQTRFDSGFNKQLNFDFLAWGEGCAELGLAVNDRHLNMSGIIHGGVLATLMDVAGAQAGSYVNDQAMSVLTLSLTT